MKTPKHKIFIMHSDDDRIQLDPASSIESLHMSLDLGSPSHVGPSVDEWDEMSDYFEDTNDSIHLGSLIYKLMQDGNYPQIRDKYYLAPKTLQVVNVIWVSEKDKNDIHQEWTYHIYIYEL